MILRIQDTVLTINMHSIAWHISTQSYVSGKGWGEATLEKSLKVQLRGNSSPLGTAGTQTRPWTEIYQDRTSTDENIYRAAGWRAILSSHPVCQLQLILFSFKMWINTTVKKISFIFWKWLCCAVVSGWYKWHYQSRQHKTICTWEEKWGQGREGGGSWVRITTRERQLCQGYRPGLYLAASSHAGMERDR